MPGEPRLAAVAACLCLLAARDAAGQMSRDTPKLRELQEQQAAADATWTPITSEGFRQIAALRRAHYVGLDANDVFKQLDVDESRDLSREEVKGFAAIIEKRKAEIDAAPVPEDSVTYPMFEAMFNAGGEYETATWLEPQFKPDGGWPFIYNRLDVDKNGLLSAVEFSYLGKFLGLDAQEGLQKAIDDKLFCS